MKNTQIIKGKGRPKKLSEKLLENICKLMSLTKIWCMIVHYDII